MAKEHYFDISAKLDFQEMKNAIIQAEKEVATRFDFKGVTRDIKLNEKDKTLVLISSSDSKIDALKEIVVAKVLKRGISSNVLDEIKSEKASLGDSRVTFKLVDSIDKDETKKIIKEIKDRKLKVQAINQGDSIRVSAKKLDDLQSVMAHVKGLDLKAPLVFDNFR